MKNDEYTTDELQELFGIESDNLEKLMEDYCATDEELEFVGGMESADTLKFIER